MDLDDLFRELDGDKEPKPTPPPADTQEEQGREEKSEVDSDEKLEDANTPRSVDEIAERIVEIAKPSEIDFDSITEGTAPPEGEVHESELPSEEEVEDIESGELHTEEDKPGVHVCRHDCKCGKSWSHMISPEECEARHTNDDTTCPDCVLSDNHAKVADKDVLSWEVQVNNSEIARCVNMDQAQLIEHIKFLQKQINELRIRQNRSRALLAERMEKDFTDGERADFKKALKSAEKRQKVQDKKERVTGNQKERAIKSLMNALGISREKAEKMVEGD